MQRQTMPEAEEQYGVARLVAFSDGVFGFAITLLITSIPWPELPRSASADQIGQQLLALLPNFYSYVLSFYIIGIYWVAHHRAFRYIIKFDTTLVWMNLTLLLLIAFLPFSTSLLGRYPNIAIINALYATTLATLSLLYLLLWWYASSQHRLIAPDLDQQLITQLRGRGLIPLAIFIISIGLSFLSPFLAQAAWISIFFVRPIFLRGYVSGEA
jgi:uncharacterized membrane protein